jgi:putative ABC transport system permease protein
MEVNGGVLAFTAAVSLLTAVIVAAAPAVAASRTDPQRALSDAGRSGSEGRGRHRLRGLLVMAEMALSLTMLAGTIVTVRGFAAMARENPGYRVDHALTMQLTAPIATYHTEADAERMYQRLVDRVRGEPGVKDAALTNGLPAEWSDFRARIFLEGEPRPTRAEPARSPRWRMVSPEYFATMDVPLVAGRLFTTHDDTLAPAVVVVSEAMARAYWPGQSPIGKRIGCACDDTTMITVIGVVADARFNPNAGAAVLPTYYVPTAQAHPWRTMTLVVRTVDDPAAMARRVGAAIASVAPTVAPGGVLTLDHLQQTALSPQRLTAEMMAVFAVVALLLAAVGIYGVTSYSVAQRTHDIGIRTALGARPGDIVRGVLGGALSMAGIGIVVGLVGAVAMTRALAHLLTDLSPGDPLSLAAAVLVLAAAAAVGSWLPARRAMRVDPAIALRRET